MRPSLIQITNRKLSNASNVKLFYLNDRVFKEKQVFKTLTKHLRGLPERKISIVWVPGEILSESPSAAWIESLRVE